jgi:hypothetical protein
MSLSNISQWSDLNKPLTTWTNLVIFSKFYGLISDGQ